MTAKIVICSLLVAFAFAGDQSYGTSGSFRTGTLGSQGSSKIRDQGYSSGVSGNNRLGGHGLGSGVSGNNRLVGQGYSSVASGNNRLVGQGYSSGVSGNNNFGGRSRVLNNGGLRTLKNSNGYNSQGSSLNKAGGFRSVGGGVIGNSYNNNGISGSQNTHRISGLTGGNGNIGVSQINPHRNIGSNQNSGIHDFTHNTGNNIGGTHAIGSGGTSGYSSGRRISGNVGFNGNSLSNIHPVHRTNSGFGGNGISGTHQIGNQIPHGSNSFSKIRPISNQNVHSNNGFSGGHQIVNQGSIGSGNGYDNNVNSNAHLIGNQGIGQSGNGYGNNGISGSKGIGNQDILHSGSGSNNYRISNTNSIGSSGTNVGYGNSGSLNKGRSFGGNNILNNRHSVIGGSVNNGNRLLTGNSGIHNNIHSNNGLISNKGSGNVFNRRGLVNSGLSQNGNLGTHAIGNQGISRSGNNYGSNGISGIHQIENQGPRGGNLFSGDHPIGNKQSSGGYSNNAISNTHSLSGQGIGNSNNGYNNGISGSNTIGNQGNFHSGSGSNDYRLSNANRGTNVGGYGTSGNINNGGSIVGNNRNSLVGGSLRKSSGLINGGSGIHNNFHSNNGLVNNKGSGNTFVRHGLNNNGISRIAGGRGGSGYQDVNVLSVNSGIRNVGSVGNLGSGTYRNTGGRGIGNVHNNVGNVGNVHQGVNSFQGNVGPVESYNVGNGNRHRGSISGSRQIVGDHGIVGDIHRGNLGNNGNVGDFRRGNLAGGQGYSGNRGQVSFVNQGGDYSNVNKGTSRGIGRNSGYRNDNNIANTIHNVNDRRIGNDGQGYASSNGVGNIVNGNAHNNFNNNDHGRGNFNNNNNFRKGGIVGSRSGSQSHSIGIAGPNTGKKNCFRDFDLGKDFDFSDRASDFPREKIIRELQGRPHLRTKMGIDGAFVAKDFDVLTGFGKKRFTNRKRRSIRDDFNDGGFFSDKSVFDTPSDQKFDLQSSQLQRLKGLVQPSAEVCPSNRRPLRSFKMNGSRCYTINRKDSPTMFATCTRRECPECSRNRGRGRCVEEFEKASVFAWCDGNSFSNNIREVSLLVPKHCGGKSYDC